MPPEGLVSRVPQRLLCQPCSLVLPVLPAQGSGGPTDALLLCGFSSKSWYYHSSASYISRELLPISSSDPFYSVYLVLLLRIPCRDLTSVLILNRSYPFLVHRLLLPEESSRCNDSKQSRSSDKTPRTGQGLKIIKSTSLRLRMMSRARGNLESRQGDCAMGN